MLDESIIAWAELRGITLGKIGYRIVPKPFGT
jgi:hypothetical protein